MNFEEPSRKFAGKWITTPEFAQGPVLPIFHRQLDPVRVPEEKRRNRHILFRRSFVLPSFQKATLWLTADDAYKLYINGNYVCQGPAPGYPWHYYYQKIDVTPYLREGTNLIAVHTYYQGLINRVWVSGDGRHGLLLDLCCDGKLMLATDSSWRWHLHGGYEDLGTTGYETQFLERYDSGSTEEGFASPDYDDSDWESACERMDMGVSLYEQQSQAVVIEQISPMALRRISERVYQVDFGSVYVGTMELEARGPRGSRIVLRYGQELTPEGRVRFALRANCRYEEEWILSGGNDTLRHFDYLSFRYAEITLPEGAHIEEDSFRLLARHYPFRQQASCQTDHPTLRRVWDLCVHSLRYGPQEALMDCMEREKGQYLGDGCFTSTSYAVLTGDTALMEKLIDDTLYSSVITTGLMTCAACSFMQEIADYCLMLPMLLRVHWHLRHDEDYIRRRYPVVLRMMETFRDSYGNAEGLLENLDKWCVVEWPPEARDGYDFELTQGKIVPGLHNVINAYYIGALMSMERLAEILRLPSTLPDAERLKAQYIRRFWDREAALFRDHPDSRHHSLPSNALALLFDLCPDARTQERIVSMIEEKRLRGSMFFISMAILSALVRIGRKELALELIQDEAAWPRMLREGATTTWEGWGKDSKWNTSLFHLAFTYPILFLTDWGMEKLL